MAMTPVRENIFSNKRLLALIIILAVAAFLRLYALGSGDAISDEAAFGFRAIGLVDMVPSAGTTPFQWHDPNLPWWVHLSFYDDPPLGFWLEHISFTFFGVSTFALRFPATVFGVLSVFLLYKLGKELYSEEVGLIAAAILAVSVNNVTVSRLGILESFVIFFLLLGSYCFLRSLREETYALWNGVAAGFGLLTKYTVAILAPIYLTYVLCFRRDYLSRAKVWIGVALAILILSPVIIYNAFLYKTVGHFDYQIASSIGQSHPEWLVQPGKDIGTLPQRLAAFLPFLSDCNSPLFLLFLACSLVTFFMYLYQKPAEIWRKHAYLAIAIFWISFFILLLIGPAYRFLTMLTPFFALCIALFFVFIKKKFPEYIFTTILIGFLFFEFAYTVNNQLIPYPIGSQPWFSSLIRLENPNAGYNQLDAYLKNEFANKTPLWTSTQYGFIDQIRAAAIQTSIARNNPVVPFVILYDGDMSTAERMWIMDRRLVYDGWLTMPIGLVSAPCLHKDAPIFCKYRDFKDVYVVLFAGKPYSQDLMDLLKGAEMTQIKNPRGDVVFNIYKVVW